MVFTHSANLSPTNSRITNDILGAVNGPKAELQGLIGYQYSQCTLYLIFFYLGFRTKPLGSLNLKINWNMWNKHKISTYFSLCVRFCSSWTLIEQTSNRPYESCYFRLSVCRNAIVLLTIMKIYLRRE